MDALTGHYLAIREVAWHNAMFTTYANFEEVVHNDAMCNGTLSTTLCNVTV